MMCKGRASHCWMGAHGNMNTVQASTGSCFCQALPHSLSHVQATITMHLGWSGTGAVDAPLPSTPGILRLLFQTLYQHCPECDGTCSEAQMMHMTGQARCYYAV